MVTGTFGTSFIPQEKIDEVDKLWFSPKERAEDVNAALQIAARELNMDYSLFDTTCFAVQWLAMLAVGALSSDKDFVRIARLANIWLHDKHYNAPEEIHGKPDRGKREEGTTA